VADEADWPEDGLPYGLPFFRDDAGEIRAGVVVMPAGAGDFWVALAQELRDASPRGYAKVLATYPDGLGGVDLQPFFDLVTVMSSATHLRGSEICGCRRSGSARSSSTWPCTRLSRPGLPAGLPTLELLPTVGAGSRRLAARMRVAGYSTLEELEAHYSGC
jgi:hypothetical protein